MTATDAAGNLVEILLMEDNAADVALTRQALLEIDFAANLHVARNGEEGIAFLRRAGEFSKAPQPSLILLDLNMPRKNGREVLAEIKLDNALKRIPVVVLTMSRDENDIRECYDLLANAYMHKPLDFDGFVRVMRGIRDYWFTLVNLPG